MKLKETCENWSLDFKHDNDIELTADQKELLGSVLHTAGDSLSVFLGMPDDEAALRNKILQVIMSIFLDTRTRVQMAVEFTIMNHAITTPLQKGFTDEELFGENLTEALKATLKSDGEVIIADEYLNPKPEEPDGEEETDDD